MLHAIKNKVQITFSYQKFWEDEISQRIAEPYALKEFKNRWYVLANQKLTLFATRDFIMEIISFGEDVKVVGPEGLVMEVKKGFEGGLKRYS